MAKETVEVKMQMPKFEGFEYVGGKDGYRTPELDELYLSSDGLQPQQCAGFWTSWDKRFILRKATPKVITDTDRVDHLEQLAKKHGRMCGLVVNTGAIHVYTALTENCTKGTHRDIIDADIRKRSLKTK